MMSNDFFNRAIETMPREAIRRSQDERVRALMAALGENPFYTRKLAAAGVEAAAVRSMEDLSRLPMTTKAELVEAQAGSPPFGDLLSLPLSRYRYLHQTSGTTGAPLKWLDTEHSWRWFRECWQYVLAAAGIRHDDILYFPFSFGPYLSHWGAIESARHLGALCISGAGLSSEQRLRSMQDNGCTVLVCTPTYALRLARVAEENGLDLAGGPVRATIHAGEPGASVPNVKRAIESAWGVRCYDHAGATEVGAWGYACRADESALHLNEREFAFEVVDPRTGQAVAEGERGELVITNFGRPAMPVVRYRTGDIVERTDEPCACGRTFARIKGGVLARADDMLIVRGVNLYPSAIDNLVRAHPEIVEYAVDIRRLRGMDDLTVRVELAGGARFEQTAARLETAFREAFSIAVTVAEARPGSLPRYELKAQRYRRVD